MQISNLFSLLKLFTNLWAFLSENPGQNVKVYARCVTLFIINILYKQFRPCVKRF